MTPQIDPPSPLADLTSQSLRQLYEEELAKSTRLQRELETAQEAAGALERFAIHADASLRQAHSQIEKLRALHRVALRLNASLGTERVWSDALELLETLIPCLGLAAYARDGSRVAVQGVPLLDLASIAARAPDVVTWALRADNPGSLTSADGRFLAVPVIPTGTLEGAIVLARRKGERFDPTEVELAEMVALVVTQGIDGARRYREMEEQALSDALTGVANYRYFRQQIELEVARAQRFRYPLGLLIADIDHFKKINDRFGHPAGDSALSLAAHAMRGAIRRSDVLARVGGEEFAVILPACDLQQAQVVGDKLRLAVRSTETLIRNGGEPIALTVSVGGTAMAGADLDAQTLIDRADAALFQAKRSGRDRTVVVDDVVSS